MVHRKSIAKSHNGFTLIELMIVVAIIGILAAAAIPAYNDYIQKSQISEVFSSVNSMQVSVSAFAQENGVYPSANDISAGIGASTSGRYSSATTTAGTGVIVVTIASTASPDIGNKTIIFTPPTIAGATSFAFSCTSTVKQKYLPKSCVGV